ncbi:MAG: hypothetical protein V4577_24725 [Bacteroidota bacterium]
MKARFVEQATDMWKSDLSEESMIFSLKDAGADPNEIDGIIAAGYAEYVAQRTVINKTCFYVALGLLIVTIIVFIAVLPGNNMIVGKIPLYSILGTVLTCLFAFYTFAYRNTWKSPFIEKRPKPKIFHFFLVTLILPGIVVYWIFSARFSWAQESVLKGTQVEAIAHVLNGRTTGIKQLLRGGAITHTSVTVGFVTEKGDSVVVTKEIPESRLRDFYKGQELHIIYSKENPQNIDLLTDDETVRNLRKTEQRPLFITDLLRLSALKPDQLSAELNRISYGWDFNAAKGIYVNEHFKNAIGFIGSKLAFICEQEDRFAIIDSLKAKGFQKVSTDDSTDILHTGPFTFENAQYRVDLRVEFIHPGVDGDGPEVVMVTKK